MDRTDEYAAILKRIVHEYGSSDPAHGQIKSWTVCDDGQRRYAIVCIGWHEPKSPMQGRRVRDLVFFAHVADGKIHLEHDGLGEGITAELLDAGVAEDDIIYDWMNVPKPVSAT